VIAETAVRFNPFPGLRSFEPEEEHLFFGREKQIDELLARLRRTRFLAVVGTSGSGKSSLVRSGLIPALHGGFMTKAGSSWRVAVFRPGDDPIGNLAAALATPEVLGCDPEIADLHRTLIDTTLHRSARGLTESVRLARIPERDNVLLLVDQFEELFRFKRNPRIRDSQEEAVAFVRLLLEAARQTEVPVYVVLTMRSDFIGSCTELPGLAEATNDGQYLVPRMTREERRAAILGPVAVGGADIAPRLVLRLLNDVGDDLDQLPILQHALMRTWDRWEGDHRPGEVLDLRHFEAAGTLREALSLHAEEAYRELTARGDRRPAEIAAVLFKALTERGSGHGVRRPTRLAEICALAGAGEEEVMRVVDGFRLPGRSFLMPPCQVALTADTVLDISHESLMRIWERLIDWVDEEGRSAKLYLRLSKAAAEYQEGNGGLWRDPELQLALNWREETRPTAVWAERYDPAFERAMLFLDYSRQERDQALEKRERERRRQLLRTRLLALTLGAAALVVLVFGLYALTVRNEAEQSAYEAQQQKFAAESHERDARRQRENALLQKRRAEEESRHAEAARRAAERQREIAQAEGLRARAEESNALAQKRNAEQARELAETARRQAEEAKSATETQRAEAVQAKLDADAQRVKAESSGREARRLGMLQAARALALQAARLQRDDQRQTAALLAVAGYRLHLRSGGDPDDAGLFEALRTTAARLESPEALRHQDAVRAVALAGDGRTLFAGGDDGAVLRADLGAPDRKPARLGALADGVRSLALRADGGRLAAGGLDGGIDLWDLGRPGSAPRILRTGGAAGSAVNALAFQPGSGRLAAGGADGSVVTWSADLSETTILLAPQPFRVTALAFSPDGQSLAAATAGGGLLLLTPGEPGSAPRVLGAAPDLRSAAFSEDGRLLAAGTASGTVLLWEPGEGAGSLPVELTGHTGAVTAAAFLPGQHTLATASLDGSVRLWSLERPGTDVVVLQGAAWVWALAVAPDGSRVVTGGADRAVRAWWTHAQPLADAICRQASRSLTREEWNEHAPAGLEFETTCP
jgi:cell division protein FtsN/energy-coupling factor transporter ATP-binding protein EcfA2